jgi:AcrR family transcriptional regulator
MEKALELFANQGFEATSVQQITDYCGISKGAFYLSFKSKDELILALIDHFMKQFTADIDYAVNNTIDTDLLYSFYDATFKSFHEHSDFAKLLIKEQAHTLNQELIVKMRYFDSLLDKTILTMLDRLYGEKITHTKYDLTYCVKGLMNTYSGLFLFNNVPFDIDLLARSLVEKTDILAQNTTIPFISHELLHVYKSQAIGDDLSKEHLSEQLELKIKEIETPIEKESLTLLQQELHEPSLSPAIIQGLLENIRKHPHCKWIAYLLQNYIKNRKPS